MLDCERCGNCCTRECEHLTFSEEGLAECKIHHDKPDLCRTSPNKLFAGGKACRAAIRRALELDPTLQFDIKYEGVSNPTFNYDRKKIPPQIIETILDER